MQRVLAPARTVLRHPSLVVVLGCNLLLGLAYSFVGPFFSMFGTIEVGMTPAQFGAFMTVTAVAAIALSTALARWSDTRWSRRAMLLLGCASGAAGYFAYAHVRDFFWLTVIGSTVLGISSITFSQLFAHAREQLGTADIPPTDAPLYMNLFRLFFALAWTVGPAAASWVLVFYSYRGMFLVAGGLFLVLLLTVWRFIPTAPPPAAQHAAAHTPLWHTLRRPDLTGYFAGFVLINTAGTMGMMNLPLLVLKSLGGDAHHVGIIFSIAPIFELPLMFYLGVLASRGDQTRIIRAGALIAIAYYALLSCVRAPWHVYPLQLLAAAMTAVNSGLAITFFQNYLPGQPGTATNLYMTTMRTGSTAGYLLFGWLASAFGFRAVFVVCASLAVVTFALFWSQHRRTQRTAVPAATG